MLILTIPASCFFSFTATPTTQIYTLSLHDALPISTSAPICLSRACTNGWPMAASAASCTFAATGSCTPRGRNRRSEEHTSELQSLRHLVCRLLLEKKKKKKNYNYKAKQQLADRTRH